MKAALAAVTAALVPTLLLGALAGCRTEPARTEHATLAIVDAPALPAVPTPRVESLVIAGRPSDDRDGGSVVVPVAIDFVETRELRDVDLRTQTMQRAGRVDLRYAAATGACDRQVDTSTTASSRRFSVVAEDRLTALIEDGQPRVLLPSHGDWASDGSPCATAYLRADGSLALLGTELAVAAYPLPGGPPMFLRGTEQQELALLTTEGRLLQNGELGSTDAVEFHDGMLVWGAFVIGRGRARTVAWPRLIDRTVLGSSEVAILVEPPQQPEKQDARAPGPRHLVVPDVSEDIRIELPDTRATVATYIGKGPQTRVTRRVAVDEHHTRVGWGARDLLTSVTLRSRSLVDGSHHDVTVPTHPRRLQPTDSDEEVHLQPPWLRYRPGHDALLFVDDSESRQETPDLVQADMVSRIVTRFPSVEELLALSPSGEWAVAATPSSTASPVDLVVLNLDTGAAVRLGLSPPLRSQPPDVAVAPDSASFVVSSLRDVGDLSDGGTGGVHLERRATTSPATVLGQMDLPGDRASMGLALSATAVFLVDGKMNLRVLDSALTRELGEIWPGDTWAAARFADGKVEIWSDGTGAATSAADALWCVTGPDTWARWATCRDRVEVRGRMAAWFDTATDAADGGS